VRIPLIVTALIALTACSGGNAQRGGTIAKTNFLSAIQVVPAPMHTGSTGAPIVGLVVSGTITNDGSSTLQCTRSTFVLMNPSESDIAPSAEFCALPSIPPKQSTYFNATFAAPPRDDWKLRFEHGDGSYEVHDLIVPPAG
jgi:hypothetical protein